MFSEGVNDETGVKRIVKEITTGEFPRTDEGRESMQSMAETEYG